MSTLTFQIPPPLADLLREQAASEGKPIQQWVEDLIERHVREKREKARERFRQEVIQEAKLLADDPEIARVQAEFAAVEAEALTVGEQEP